MRSIVCAFLFALALGANPVAAQPAAPKASTVSTVSVHGVVDSAVERTISTVLQRAERSDVVVLQINSGGVVGAGRLERILEEVRETDALVVAWIGPPGAQARHGAAMIAERADVLMMAPGTAFGPIRTTDIRVRGERNDPAISAQSAEDQGIADSLELDLPDVLNALNETEHNRATLELDPSTTEIKFIKVDFLGRATHGMTQASIVYIFLLVGLAGIIFELFHPSLGPVGFIALVFVALATYGAMILGASPLGAALIVIGLTLMCVDLRYAGFGIFTFSGVTLFIVGCIRFFPGPEVFVNPIVVATGIIGIVLFMIGAMTRVLRDLRLLARGEIQVTDPHPH